MYEIITVSLGLVVSISLLLGGIPIAVAVGLAGVLTLLLNEGLGSLNAISFIIWGSVNNASLSSLPLFILMAEFMLRSGVSDSYYSGTVAAHTQGTGRAAADQYRELLSVRGHKRVQRRDGRRDWRRGHSTSAQGWI